MNKLSGLYPQKTFEYFEQLSAVPRGSGNTSPIADFMVAFAEAHSLRYYRDGADNVIIYKPATKGYEKSEPVILQGHLDMVCQKTPDSDFDFSKDGIRLIVEGDIIKADGTTLGADNGIAVAMTMAILDSDTLPHPAIEAVFTSNEEIGMLGAWELDYSRLSAKRLINLDQELESEIVVSCAGGIEFNMTADIETRLSSGTAVTLTLSGLLGGHSGVEIDKGRVNADILLGRFLNHLKGKVAYDIISLCGGDKANAIPLRAEAVLCTKEPLKLSETAKEYSAVISKEIFSREPSFKSELTVGKTDSYTVLADTLRDKLIFALNLCPNGIIEMSREIKNLVETSLNLGILTANSKEISLVYNLRSSKTSALRALQDRLTLFADTVDFRYETSGFYPPWEFNDGSLICELYKKIYAAKTGNEPNITAIHAGLECAVFAGKIKELDCIAIGPDTFDCHTVGEHLSVSSVGRIYDMVVELLKRLK